MLSNKINYFPILGILFAFGCASQTPKSSEPPIHFYKGQDTSISVKNSELGNLKMVNVNIADGKYPILKGEVRGVTGNPLALTVQGAIEEVSKKARKNGYNSIYITDMHTGKATSYGFSREAYFVEGAGIDFVKPDDQILLRDLVRHSDIRSQWARKYIESYRLDATKEKIIDEFSKYPNEDNLFGLISNNFKSFMNVNPHKLNKALTARMELDIPNNPTFAVISAKLLLKNNDEASVKHELGVIRKKIKPTDGETKFHDSMVEYMATSTQQTAM